MTARNTKLDRRSKLPICLRSATELMSPEFPKAMASRASSSVGPSADFPDRTAPMNTSDTAVPSAIVRFQGEFVKEKKRRGRGGMGVVLFKKFRGWGVDPDR